MRHGGNMSFASVSILGEGSLGQSYRVPTKLTLVYPANLRKGNITQAISSFGVTSIINNIRLNFSGKA